MVSRFVLICLLVSKKSSPNGQIRAISVCHPVRWANRLRHAPTHPRMHVRTYTYTHIHVRKCMWTAKNKTTTKKIRSVLITNVFGLPVTKCHLQTKIMRNIYNRTVVRFHGNIYFALTHDKNENNVRQVEIVTWRWDIIAIYVWPLQLLRNNHFWKSDISAFCFGGRLSWETDETPAWYTRNNVLINTISNCRSDNMSACICICMTVCIYALMHVCDMLLCKQINKAPDFVNENRPWTAILSYNKLKME